MDKIFVDYLRGYINIHNDLLSMDVIDNPNSESKKKYEILNMREEWLNKQLDKYKDIELETTQEEIERIKLEKDLRENTKEKDEFLNNQEENRKKFNQLTKGKEGILENAKREKEERLEEANNNLNSSELMKKYKISIQREEWLNKQLDKYKDIELETTQEEIERIKLEKDLRENTKEKEDYQRQIKEKRAEIKNIGKEYSDFMNQIQFIDEKKQKIEIKEESEAEREEGEAEQEESENHIKIDDLEDKINIESDKIINDTEKDIDGDSYNENKKAKKRNIKITLGRSGKIAYGDQEFKVSKKDIKNGINFELSDIQKMCLQSDLLVNSNEEIFAELGEMFKNEEVDGLVVHAIMSAKDMDGDVKLELLGKYAKDLKDLDENNVKNNTCNVTYDLDDLSRTNIISRLFRREVNRYEKDEINDRAVMAAEEGIGKVEGEYKSSWISRIVSSIKNRRLGSKEKSKLLDEGKGKQEVRTSNNNVTLQDEIKADKETQTKLQKVSEEFSEKIDTEKTEVSKGIEISE